MIKKVLTYSVVVTTIVWSVGLLATPLAVGAAVSGDLIKLQCAAGADVNAPCKAVYYLGADGKRYVFPNEKTYKTWYSDFSGVSTVSETELSSYVIGGNATYRPGVKLAKITTDPKVYAVAKNGALRWVKTAEVAEALYGSNWSSQVEDIPDAFFVNYTVGTDIAAAADYVKDTETSNSPTINDDKGLGGGGTSVGTSLTIALASDTPATGYVVGNSINNKFTKINFTASADGDIVIDALTVGRGGTVAADGAFDSLILIDESTDRRIGNTKNLNASHEAIFNDDITVAAGTTKSIYLAGNMISSEASYAGQIPSLDLKSVTVKGSAAVIGTLPIKGNYQQVDGTVTIGTLTLTAGANNPTAGTQKIGTTNYTVTGVKLSAGSVEAFDLTQISFNQGGTASDKDVKSVDLKVDDVVVATIASPTSGDLIFDLRSNPVKIDKGKSKNFDVELDIVDGSARTIRFDVKKQVDIRAKGTLYSYEVAVTQSGVASTAEPYFTAPITTIDAGALSGSPATLVSANIPNDTKQVVLGKFELEGKGESIQITRLPIAFQITTSSASTVGNVTHADLTNISVYDENGNIVAGPADTALGYYVDGSRRLHVGVTTTDTVTVTKGVHIYTIKGDVSSDWESNDVIVARIKPNQMTAKGETTGLVITPTPASEQTSATMTIKGAALAVSVSGQPIAQTVVAGTKGYTFANLILNAADSGEDVKITSIAVAVKPNASANAAETSNWRIYDGATELAVTNDPSSDTSSKTTDDTDATSTFNLVTPLVITKGTSKSLTVKADISSSATNGATQVGLEGPAATNVVAKGANSGISATITLSVSSGQLQTFTTSGKLTISKDSTSPKEGLMPSGATGLTFAILNAYATYEKIRIEKIYLMGVQANSGGWDQIDKVYVYQGDTKVAEVTPTSSDAVDRTILVDVSNSPIVVPKDASTLLTIKVDTSSSNYEIGSKGASGQGLWIKVATTSDVTAKGDQSGTTISLSENLAVSSASSTAQYLFKSVPTVATNDLLPTSSKIASGTLAGGTEAGKALYAFSVAADSAGDLGLHHVGFRLATSTATVTELYISDGITKVAFQQTAALTYLNPQDSGTDLWNGSSIFYFVDNQTAPGTASTSANTVPYIIPAGTTKTFTLKGDVACVQMTTSNCSGASGSGSISVSFLGDSVLPGTLPNTVRGLTNNTEAEQLQLLHKLVWTDFWRTPILKTSSTTASNTEQWANSYLVALTNGGKMMATSTAVNFSR